jgi:parvulin-like peptidyl-prolyl isomerase
MRSVSIAFLFIVILITFQGVTAVSADETGVSWVCAIVDGEPITYEDLRIHLALEGQKLPLERIRSGLPISGAGQRILCDALGSLIEETIALHRAKMEKISLDDRDEAQIRQALENKAKEMGGMAQYEAIVQQAGLSIEILQKKHKILMVIRKLRQKKLSPDLFISPQELREYFQKNAESFTEKKEVTYKDIVFAVETEKRKAKESRELAQSICARLEKGEDFAALQKEFSESYEEGKDNICGPVRLESLKEALRDALSSLNAGAVSAPIEVDKWIHIVKLESRQEGKSKLLQEVCAEIEKELRKLRIDKLYSQYEAEIFKRASVKVQVPGLTLTNVSPAAARSALEQR